MSRGALDRRTLNRAAKRWPGWALLGLAVVGLLAYGATSDSGPRTPDERVTAITKRLACPVCSGESVYESRNTASSQIEQLVEQQVAEGVMSDEEIIQQVVDRYQGEELLVPTADGIEALAWALPAAAFVFAVVGLVLAFRRWQAAARRIGRATPEDYELVARAAREEQDGNPEPADPELADPELVDPELVDPELVDPELVD